MGNPPEEAEGAPHRIFNIDNNSPERLMTFIGALEKALSNALGRTLEFNKVYEPIKPGDVPATYALTDLLYNEIGFKSEASIEEGLLMFDDWYVDYYQLTYLDLTFFYIAIVARQVAETIENVCLVVLKSNVSVSTNDKSE